MQFKKIGDILTLTDELSKFSNYEEAFDNANDALNDLTKLLQENPDNLKFIKGLGFADDVAEYAGITDVITETGEAAVEASSKLTNLGKAGKGAGAVLTNAFSKLGALVVAHPIIATLAGIAVAFTAVSAVVTDAQEKVEEAISSYGKYETAQSEAESSRSELETIGTQIDELNAKENLSFTDQQELANLQAQSAELERQLEIKDAIAKREQENAARAASDALNAYSARNDVDRNQEGFLQNIIDGVSYASAWISDKLGIVNNSQPDLDNKWNLGGELANYKKNTAADDIFLDRVQAAIKAQEELNKIQNEAPELTGNYDYDTIALNQWTRKVEEQQQVVNNYADDLQNLYSEMESITPAFYNADGSIAAGYEDEVARWEKVQSEYLAFLGKPVSSVESTINGILSKVEYSEFEDILVKVGQNGSKALERVLSSGNYDGLIDSLAETLDISTDEAQSHLQDYIMAIADPDALKMDVVKDQLAEAFTPDDVDAETAKQQWQDFTKDLSDEDLTILYSIKQSKDTSTWTLEDWKHNFDEARDSAIDLSEAIEKVNSRISVLNQLGTEGISSDKLLDAISQADETENAGDDYLKADSYLDEAKKMYDKGLIGTDDFKARAAYFSPTMATDPANFIENYKKAKNYLTENATGLLNFLNDLEDKGLASSKVLKDGTKQWTYDIKDFESAAQKMGISTEFMLDIFGRLEDYGFSNNFASNVEEANEKIVDKAAELANAKAKLAEMETTGQYTTLDENGNEVKTLANSTALQEQRELVQLLEQDLLQLQNTREYLASREADTYAEQVKQAKEAYDTLKKERDEILQSNKYGDDTSSVVALLDENLAQLAEEYHLEVEPEIDIDTLSLSELESELAIATAQLDVFKDPITGEIDLSVDGAQEAIDTVDALIRKKIELSHPAVMSVDTSQLSGTQKQVVETLQAYQSAREELQIALEQMNVGIEVDNLSELESSVSNARDELVNLLTMNPEAQQIAVDLGFNIDQNSTILEINQAIDAATSSVIAEGIKATLTWENNTEEVDAFIKAAHIATGTVNWTNNTALVKTQFSATGTITWTNPYEKFVNGKGSIATGTLLSPAKASGTAYNMLNLKPAYAGGKVALEHDQTALVNELPGHEGIIRNGQLYKIPGGMHYQNLKQGDIVLSASQMEQLERTGRASGKGQPIGWARSFAQGTLIQPAYASGSGGGSFGAGGSGSKSGVTSAGEKTTKANTKATQANTKATQDNTDSNENLYDWIERMVTAFERTLQRYETLLSDETNWAGLRDSLRELSISAINSQLPQYQQAYEYYMAKANSVGLPDNYKTLAENGLINIEEITDETLRQQIENFEAWLTKARELDDTIVDLNIQLKELKMQKLDDIMDSTDTLTSYHQSIIDMLDASQEVLITKGEKAVESVYQSYMNQYNAQRQYYALEAARLENELDKLVDDGTIVKYSEKWAEYKANINEAKQNLYEVNQAIAETQDTILELRWSYFEDGITVIENMKDSLSGLADLIDDTMAFVKGTSTLSGLGFAKIGLIQNQMTQAKQAIANYGQAIDDLNELYAKGYYSESQYEEKLAELRQTQLDYASDLKNLKDSIIDLVKEGINREVDAMKELVDARQEALDKQREYYDFNEKMKDQTSEINSIEAQIQALRGNDSVEAQTKLRQLESQKRELEEELAKTQREHEQDVISQGYDDFMEEFEQNADDYMEELDSSLEAQNKAIESLLNDVSSNSETVFTYLNELANEYGLNIAENITNVWKDAQSAVEDYQKATGLVTVEPNTSVNTGAIKGETTGWQNGVYMNSDGTIATNQWISENGKEYYVGADGKKVTGTPIINGKKYVFNSSGEKQSGWQSFNGWTLYADPSDNGAVATGIREIGGKTYLFDSNGVQYTGSGTPVVNGKKYFVQNGVVKSGWQKLGNWTMYFDPTTYQAVTGKRVIDGIEHLFDSNGIMKYNSGAKYTKNGWAFIDDDENGNLALGSEAIITDNGVLMQMNSGSTVFNKDQKDFLYELSKAAISAKPLNLDSVITPAYLNNSARANTGSNETNIHYDSIIGNIEYVDKNALPELETIVKKSFDYTVKELRKQQRKL